MIAIDTNLIVRYLTGDHPEQSSRVRGIVDGQPVFVAVTVVLEAEWVLRSAYGYGRPDVARALRAFGGLSTVTIEDSAIVAAAFDLAENGMDFADALHLTKSVHCEELITFDRKFMKAAQAAGYETVREA
ncbi:type II toxin-antitoxin system VapC family toxin [Rhizobium leguminosarum]|jgi:predicted nucleic-acid-binding protein|uniref:Type II toxin-antitoxin system VapC family toxin n=1 Tax=Rhizobium leguminosarum TaxID=384 RepID=A0A444HZE2_RHILE|nr:MULTISPECIES: type II toxin-antitoxin system VapC family toxin [Rhizobium]MBY5456692.1 type II toxin-antitoxin system VapC family toxin [Rhizobium leguminosarum]NKL61844.1 PIN domain-containing protein [Rhizobium leguminosarum bv. viciae]RWX05399.1 type II toxin-antitoxin system VapC family toxin [Rhizobium leguminosarum]RWX29728.1 type II toxin-antitoxin system VapC family toxin [Rhizobium leguminosarum]TAU55683.1 type II toxin-antitoxin system VapC family toxin [Rhizobium leguminosarum]